MKIPNQSRPVLRNNVAAGISEGVEESSFWDVLKKIGSVAGPIMNTAVPLISSLL